MKDRTPKFPGRVKLKPVAGQTDTYDMTRADEPDDTGTPFNTRTMLQDSTGRFLRLPYANPLVDDAFRHMPDRIEPIGTVKTSPAFSLGKAWLPCDGSQVSFTEYPSLCQLLRGAEGTTQWDEKQIAANMLETSELLFFKGKWYVAGRVYENKRGRLVVCSSVTMNGVYSTVAEYTQEYDAYDVRATCNEEILAVVAKYNSNIIVGYTENGESWEFYTHNLKNTSGERIKGFCVAESVFALATTGAFAKTFNIKDPSAWDKGYGVTSEGWFAGISVVDGKFMLVGRERYLPSGSNAYLAQCDIFSSNVLASANDLVRVKSIRPGFYEAEFSNIVKYSDRYWIAYEYRSNFSSGILHRGYLYSSNLIDWAVGGEKESPSGGISPKNDHALVSNQNFMLLRSYDQLFLTSDPLQQESNVSLPVGASLSTVGIYGDIGVATGKGVLYYHDYSTDTRLLPIISLSDDTTTFIKAKNELDVFEAGGD